jgi:hypothetical protein
MMIRNRIVLKTFAVFFLVEIITSTVLPSLSFALTSGPTAPEATSFEPVDTTDMVNLFTGDLIYNTPLLEIPGASGGYPLSLSYHAGIQPDLDASWVGLGWTLNPGSITRLVNGYPDDSKDVNVNNHFYWKGISQTTYSIGATVGIGQGASVTAGLSFTQDSHRGFSVNPYVGGGAQLPGGIGISANNVDGAQLSSAFTETLGKISGIQNVIKKKELEYDKSFGPFGLGSLGISLSSKGIKAKLGVAGMTKDVSREGKVNRVKTSNSISIPTPYGIVGLSRTYTRTWIDESADVLTNGSIYNPLAKPDYTHMNKRAFDTYDISKSGNPDPEKVAEGTFPDYDSYSVSAQGLAGSMRPYHYYEYLYRQNREADGNAVVRNVPLGATGVPVEFRFVNDFSNRFDFEPGAPQYDVSNGVLAMNFNTNNITAGLNGKGYIPEAKQLAGSRHVKYYTNTQINNNEAKNDNFINCTAAAFDRTQCPADQVGGFKITNENGLTYHFALPAYSFDEITYSEKIDAQSPTYNRVTKPGRYAYTWFLTGITGPDYVDRGGPGGTANGILDENDWGYWVEFSYRKHASAFEWRNPGSGFNVDIDNNFQNYAYGKKELYYLDYVRTVNHIALFEKSVRNDGRGVSGIDGGYSTTSSTYKLNKISLLTFKDFQSLGGFNIVPQLSNYANDIKLKSLKSIDFSTDYSLCPKTPNSFVFAPGLLGKLTLNSITFFGKGGLGSLPPVKFSYEPNSPIKTNVYLEKTDDGKGLLFKAPDISLMEGDLIKLDNGSGKIFYGLVVSKTYFGQYDLKLIDGDINTFINGVYLITLTKNPPYNKEKADMWGFYKSDYEQITNDKTLGRFTTEISARNVDAWSLQSVTTILGAKIKLQYEVDDYDEIVLAKQQALRIKNVVKEGNQLRIYFFDDGLDIMDHFEYGVKTDLLLIGGYKKSDLTLTNPPANCTCPSIGSMLHEAFYYSVTIMSINPSSNSISVENNQLMSALSTSVVHDILEDQSCGEDIVCQYTTTKNWPTYIVGGALYSYNKQKLGGGIRVKSIAIEQFGRDNVITNYVYRHGSTTYEPVGMTQLTANEDYLTFLTNLGGEIKGDEYAEASLLFKQKSWRGYDELMNIAREVPGPGVMYKEVEVRTSAVDKDGNAHVYPTSQVFAFETFRKDFVKHKHQQLTGSTLPVNIQKSLSGIVFDQYSTNEASLNDVSAAVGSMKSITTQDATSGIPLESTTIEYLHDAYYTNEFDYANYQNILDAKFKRQGLLKESFANGRLIRRASGKYTLFGITSKRRTYPVIEVKRKSKNYKTGIESTSQTVAFDFFSGEATEGLTSDEYGNYYLSKTVPAYAAYGVDGDMGLAIYGGKNMLVQNAASYLYQVNSQTDLTPKAIVSASAQTWTNQTIALEPGQSGAGAGTQPKVWRKGSAFSFIGIEGLPLTADGFHQPGTYEFNAWMTNTAPSGWQRGGSTMLYDVHSHELEFKDMNDQYAATKFNPSQTLVIATALNSTYNDFCFSGAEDTQVSGTPLHTLGFVKEGTRSSVKSHTGKNSVLASAGIKAFSYYCYPKTSNDFLVSVWTTNPDITFKCYDLGEKLITNKKIIGQAGGWYLVEATFSFTARSEIEQDKHLEVWIQPNVSGIYIDDFRLQPTQAIVTGYVYDETGTLTHTMDNRNLYTRFEYDVLGRLIKTYRETLQYGEVKVNETEYHNQSK